MNNIFSATLFAQETKIWSGPPKPEIFDPKISAGRAVLWALNQNPGFVAQISCNSGVRKTNRDLHDASLKIAMNLEKIGCCKGDVVGFVSRSNEDLAPAVLAALLLAAIISALDPTCTTDEIIHMYGITRPKFIFCESDKVEILQEALEVIKCSAKIIVFDERMEEHLHIEDFQVHSGDISEFNPPEVDDNTCAVIFCTSGTTGLPKGVCLTHKNLLFLGSYGYVYGVEKPSSILCFSSIYWYTGLQMILLGGLMGLTRLITTDPYSPDLFYQLLRDYRPGVILAGTVHLAGILNHDLLEENTLDSVRFFICTGGVTPVYYREKAKKYLRNGQLHCCYGMSEVGFISLEETNSKKPSVGILLAGLSAKVVNKNGEKLGVGQQGEICIKGRHSFTGYYNNPQETKRILHEDGFIHTGDLGFFDEDNFLHIVGRSKDILKYNNFIIAPAEIENVILTISDVLQVVVVGVPHPESGDLPAATIILKKRSKVTEKNICSVVQKRLSDPKRLRGGVYFVERIPLTPSGKVKRILVTEMVQKLYKDRQ